MIIDIGSVLSKKRRGYYILCNVYLFLESWNVHRISSRNYWLFESYVTDIVLCPTQRLIEGNNKIRCSIETN